MAAIWYLSPKEGGATVFKALHDYAISRGLASSPGMNTKKIFWRIDLDSRGRYLGLTPLIDSQGQPGLVFANVPEQRANVMNSGGRSHFMVETADVVLLYGFEKIVEEKKRLALRAKHDYYASLLRDSSAEFPPNGLCAQLLEDEQACEQIRKDLAALKAKATQTVAFAVGGQLLVRQTDWHSWWISRRAKEGTSGGNSGESSAKYELMRCLMSGDLVKPVVAHDKVKGLGPIGGQALSTLVSFDKDAFSSFGLSGADNAAMSEVSVKTYLDAMNDLVQKGTTYYEMGLMMLTWYREPLSDPAYDPIALLSESPEEATDEEAEEALFAAIAASDSGKVARAERRAKEIIRAIDAGERPDLMGNRYNIIVLSSTGARIMIRDYREIAFSELARNVDRWFDDTRLVRLHSSGSMLRPPRFLRLIASLATTFASGKLNWESVPASLATNLYLAALLNREIPYAALEKAVLRLRKEAFSGGVLVKSKEAKVRGINYAALQLMRAYHARKNRTGVKEMPNPLGPGLNPEHPEAAYQAGRLMAVLADLQRAALGDVGAGVIERFYGSFSTTPALVYGRMVHLAQTHLSKLSGGLRHFYNAELGSINANIVDKLPATLTIEQQSLFALGYYQQMHHMFERSARRKAERASLTDIRETKYEVVKIEEDDPEC